MSAKRRDFLVSAGVLGMLGGATSSALGAAADVGTRPGEWRESRNRFGPMPQAPMGSIGSALNWGSPNSRGRP